MGLELRGMELVADLEKQGLALLANDSRRYQQAGLTAAKLFAFIYLYQSLLPELNEAKGRLDTAHKNENLNDFNLAMADFKRAASKLATAKKELKARRKLCRFKIHIDLFNSAMSKIQFIENNIANGERWAKRAAMSPAQRSAAAKASARMSAAWGS